ncbi:MAG: GntR family transcriptional regulator [Thermaerobacter sp.]|nr:GntR family transcriptional regulator [Thermaerobacter sp.]
MREMDGRLLHEQIADQIVARIKSGEWPAHYKLSSEPQLARQWQVARGTVQRALGELIASGLLYRIRGRGTFVAALVSGQPLAQRLQSISEALDRQGGVCQTRVLALTTTMRIPPWAATALSLPLGKTALALKRVKGDQQGPVALIETYLRTDFFPGIEQVDFRQHRLFDVIEKDYRRSIDWGSRVFDVAVADAEMAQALAVKVSTPLLFLEQTTYLVGNIAVECSRSWIRTDRLAVRSVIRR